MRLHLKALVAVLVLSVAGFAMAAAPETKAPAKAADYQIKLIRPAKVGAEYKVAVAAEQAMKNVTKEGDKVVKEEANKMSVDFAAAVKVVEVDKNGEPSKVSMTVDKCVVKIGAAEQSPIAKGTVVVGSVKNNHDVFEVGGKAVDPDAAEILAMVVSLGKGGTSDDETFGAKDRKKVGDKWDVNAAAFAKGGEESGIAVSKDDVKGTVTLVKAETMGTVDCLDIQGDVTVGKIVPPMPIPPGFKVEKAALQAHLGGKFPVDLALPAVEQSMGMNMTTVVKGKPAADGPEITVESTVSQTKTTQLTYAK